MKSFFSSILLLCITTTLASSANAAGNLETRVAALEAQNTALMDLLAGASRVGDTLVLEGMNLQIINGLGSTDGDQGSGPQVNGLGNLIVGYDENSGSDNKSGSHNLVVGPRHYYSSYGGLLGGANNVVIGAYSSVSGGEGNTASGFSSHISGGSHNNVSGHRSNILGGRNNDVSHQYSIVLGGNGNASTAIDSIDP